MKLECVCIFVCLAFLIIFSFWSGTLWIYCWTLWSLGMAPLCGSTVVWSYCVQHVTSALVFFSYSSFPLAFCLLLSLSWHLIIKTHLLPLRCLLQWGNLEHPTLRACVPLGSLSYQGVFISISEKGMALLPNLTARAFKDKSNTAIFLKKQYFLFLKKGKNINTNNIWLGNQNNSWK